MKLQDAIGLIKHESIIKPDKQVWADLGCGTGTFTLALASLLTPGSIIYAVDKNKSSLDKIPEQFNSIKIVKINKDFSDSTLPENLDGIIMANSLHYIRDKESFIKRISTDLIAEGSYLIVEYDTEKSNPWVPYPISLNSLGILFGRLGYNTVVKINQRPSLYRKEPIYSAVVRQSIKV